jgi:hypothetical protein
MLTPSVKVGNAIRSSATCSTLIPAAMQTEQYRARRQARVGGLINEYRLVA